VNCDKWFLLCILGILTGGFAISIAGIFFLVALLKGAFATKSNFVKYLSILILVTIALVYFGLRFAPR